MKHFTARGSSQKHRKAVSGGNTLLSLPQIWCKLTIGLEIYHPIYWPFYHTFLIFQVNLYISFRTSIFKFLSSFHVCYFTVILDYCRQNRPIILKQDRYFAILYEYLSSQELRSVKITFIFLLFKVKSISLFYFSESIYFLPKKRKIRNFKLACNLISLSQD